MVKVLALFLSIPERSFLGMPRRCLLYDYQVLFFAIVELRIGAFKQKGDALKILSGRQKNKIVNDRASSGIIIITLSNNFFSFLRAPLHL